MKTRQGFVSNSSSSSFIVVGTTMKEKELKKLNWYDDENGPDEENLPEGIEVYYTEGGNYIVGEPLADCYDYGMDNAEYTQEELQKVFEKVSKKLDTPVRLIMGQRPT